MGIWISHEIWTYGPNFIWITWCFQEGPVGNSESHTGLTRNPFNGGSLHSLCLFVEGTPDKHNCGTVNEIKFMSQFQRVLDDIHCQYLSCGSNAKTVVWCTVYYGVVLNSCANNARVWWHVIIDHQEQCRRVGTNGNSGQWGETKTNCKQTRMVVVGININMHWWFVRAEDRPRVCCWGREFFWDWRTMLQQPLFFFVEQLSVRTMMTALFRISIQSSPVVCSPFSWRTVKNDDEIVVLCRWISWWQGEPHV